MKKSDGIIKQIQDKAFENCYHDKGSITMKDFEKALKALDASSNKNLKKKPPMVIKYEFIMRQEDKEFIRMINYFDLQIVCDEREAELVADRIKKLTKK